MNSEYLLNVNVPVCGTADVVVVGGGPAGVAASIAAARCGKKVILAEQTAQLGGMGTLCNVSIFMPVGNVTGIYREIINELIPGLLEKSDKRKFSPQFNPFLMRCYLNRKLEQENVGVYYHTSFVSVIKEGNVVKCIIVNTREGLRAINGKVFIDCTGNASLAINAGAAYTSGRPSDGMPQPMTLMFQMQNTGKPVKRNMPDGCYYYEHISELPQGRLLYWEDQNGTLLVNMTRVKGNGAKNSETAYAEKEALKQVFSVADYLQRNGFENYILSHVAAQVGARETNQIAGLYVLNEEDVTTTRKFHDVIARTNYEIDIHSPDGKKDCREIKVTEYDIPYRCLVPRDVDSILVAGRAISATHIAMSSLRVQPTCFALGQAAGAAASISVDNGCSPRDISIEKLHEVLYGQGVEF